MSHKMKFPQKLCLAFSCFLPLYLVFGAKNLMATKEACRAVGDGVCYERQRAIFDFNAGLTLVWLVLVILSVIGIICFMRVLTGKSVQDAEHIKVVKAENITADYYFSYFSLFVLSFYGVDPTDVADIVIFAFMKLLIIWVYIVNDMFFINPVLNMLGYRSFSITYKILAMQEYVDEQREVNDPEDVCLECRVLSRERLNLCRNEERVLLVSRFDFSACIPQK